MANPETTLARITNKSFWKRPEGDGGKLLVGGGIALLAWILWSYHEKLAALADDTLHFGMVIGGIVFAAIVLYRMWTPLWIAFESCAVMLTNLWSTTAPVPTMKAVLNFRTKKKEGMDTQVEKMRGTVNTVQAVVSENLQKCEQYRSLARVAKEEGNEELASHNAVLAQEFEDAANEQQERLTNVKKLYIILSRIAREAGLTLEQLAKKIELFEQKRDITQITNEAIDGAVGILAPSGDEKAMLDASFRKVATDFQASMGRVDKLWEDSRMLFATRDLENKVTQKKALKALNDLDHQTRKLSSAAQVIDAEFETVTRGGSVTDLYDMKKLPVSTTKK